MVDSDLGKALLERIANEGHWVGSHTVDHISLDNLDTTRIEYELSGVEQELGNLGIPVPRVRMISSMLYGQRKHCTRLLMALCARGHLSWYLSR